MKNINILLFVAFTSHLIAANPPHNYRSGIDVVFQGVENQDWAEEYFYWDPIVDDSKVVYIKVDTLIEMKHNSFNKRQTNIPSPASLTIGEHGQDGIPDSGDEGIIRFYVDEDLHVNTDKSKLTGRWSRAHIGVSEILTNTSSVLTGGGTYTYKLADSRTPDPNDPEYGKVSLIRDQITITERQGSTDVLLASNSAAVSGFQNVDQTILSSTAAGQGLNGAVDEEGNLTLISPEGFNAVGRSFRINYQRLLGRRYPKYNGPFTFSSLSYRDNATPVLGTTGPTTSDFSNRDELYWQGIVDGFGDEWHTLTIADDDSFIIYNPDGKFSFTGHWEKLASDSKQLCFVVNPKTPCIRFEVSGDGQFYTTPAKTFNIPKIHAQTTYITENVMIYLYNIMNSNPCYYRFYHGQPSGTFEVYSEQSMQSSLSQLSNRTEYVLEYYYNVNHKKTRIVIKNPDHPSKNEQHGYMMWRNEQELEAIRERLGRSPYSYFYGFLVSRSSGRNGQISWDEGGNKGERIIPSNAVTNAFLAAVRGWDAFASGSPGNKTYAAYAKEMLVNNGLSLCPLWFGDPVLTANPSHELLYRGYWDALPIFSTALAYDLLAAHYRSDQHPNGITPIEDFYVRDSLARWNILSMMELGAFGFYGNKNNSQGMWATCRGMAALVNAMAIPTYNTPYFGTSGFDGTPATFTWTPFKDHPVTWKKAFFDPNQVQNDELYGFPNMNHRSTHMTSGTYRGPIVLEEEGYYNGKTCYPGDFADRVAYAEYTMVGKVLQIVANVAKIKHNKTYPYFELMFKRAADGLLQGAQQDEGERFYSYILVVNQYFTDGTSNSVAAKQYARMSSLDSSDGQSINGQLTRNLVYPLIWFQDNWQEMYGLSEGLKTLNTINLNGNVIKSINGDTSFANSFATGTVVQLTAVPNAGYTFTSWAGAVTGTANPITITMDGDKSVTANFAPITYTVTFNLDGKGTRTGGGALSQNITTGSNATAPTVAANTGYTFTGWDKPLTNITAAQTIKATYTQQVQTYTVTFDLDGKGTRTGGGALSQNITSGGSATAPAVTAYTGYTFTGWDKPLTNITATQTLKATYTQQVQTYTVTFDLDGKAIRTGGGALSQNITSGGSATAPAVTAYTGYTFTGWDKPLTNITATQTLKATYTQQQEYSLTASAVNGSVTVSPVKPTYLLGEIVRLTATPAAGYIFDGWAGDAAGTTRSITIVINGDKNIIAVCKNDAMAKSMTAHWALDEHYQETVRDLVSQQAATLIDNAQWSDGWKSDYVLLTTGKQALQIPMTKTTAATGSVVLWVRPDSVQGMRLIFGHTVSTPNRLALYLAAGNLAVGVGNVLQSGLCTLNVEQTYQIALTWNNTHYAVFVDGVQKGAGIFDGLTTLNSIADVGNYGDPINRDNGMGFLGAIERVQLYSRALSPSEAQELAATKYTRENRTLSFILDERDEANNRIQYNIQNMPQGAVFDVDTQTFSWLPSLYNASGNYTVVFVADNQPNKVMTLSVSNAALKSWYKDFLIMAGNKVN